MCIFFLELLLNEGYEMFYKIELSFFLFFNFTLYLA